MYLWQGRHLDFTQELETVYSIVVAGDTLFVSTDVNCVLCVFDARTLQMK